MLLSRLCIGPGSEVFGTVAIKAMKRQNDFCDEDPTDRAQRRRTHSLIRIPLDKIGFWSRDRGGTGLSSHHVRQVAHDCVANKVKLSRYGHVDIVQISEHMFQVLREENRLRCEGDSLLPAFSPTVEYVCISKTHFTHAQKLGL